MDTSSYLTAVRKVVEDEMRKSPHPINGAPLAARVRDTAGPWDEHGFRKFRDLLVQLQAMSVLSTHLDHNGTMYVIPFGSVPPPSRPAPPAAASPKRTTGTLGPPQWRAFLNPDPAGPRWLNRNTGEVRFAVPCPSPSADWVALSAIPQTTQKSWIHDFVAAQGLKGEPRIQEAMDSPAWYLEFPAALQSINPALAAPWRSFRAGKVNEYVRDWCSENAVDQASLAARPPQSVPLPTEAPSGDIPPAGGTPHSGVREAVLRALARMSTDDLLRLSIPAGLLANEFQRLAHDSDVSTQGGLRG